MRFYYCTEAMSEAVMDILNTKFGINENNQDYIIKQYLKMQKFIFNLL